MDSDERKTRELPEPALAPPQSDPADSKQLEIIGAALGGADDAPPTLAKTSTSVPATARATSAAGSAKGRPALATQKVDAEEPRERLQEFFIPVHGDVRLRRSEVAVVDHPAFQRLGEIFQLGQTYGVYRGATHMRMEHAIGAVHVAQMMMEALAENCDAGAGDRVAKWRLEERLTDDEVAFTRLGALLHDVGHLPAGHTLEDEIGLLEPHDGDERLTLVLDRRQWHGETCTPTLRELLDERYARFAAMTHLCDPATGVPLSASRILALLISKDQSAYRVPDDGTFRLNVCRDIIGNTICADLLDYLHRDWLHLGKPRAFDTRLLSYMEIRRNVDKEQDVRLVINLRGGDNVRTDAATLILDLLESRYQLAEIALFHRTKVCSAAMLERSIAELADAQGDGREAFLASLPERLLGCSDMEMLSLLDELLRKTAETASRETQKRLAGARRLIWGLRHHRLHKQFIARPEFKLADATHAVQERYTGPTVGDDVKGADKARAKMVSAQTGAGNRLSAMRLLEQDFGLEPCSLVMYCPPRKMNTKIAEVQILIHGDVHTLDRFENDHGDHGVTGGHLRAQKARFQRLWRVAVAIDEKTREDLRRKHLLEPLGRAIDLCVLQVQPPTGTVEHSVLSLARELTTRELSPLHKGRLIEEGQVAAREFAGASYPGGAPSLLSCVRH